MNKLLIVDDDVNIRKLVAILLQNDGYEVISAVDGRDALLKLGEEKIDLAIIDIMMPNMDGWELCKQIRKYYDFPILMLTAQGEIQNKVKGFKLGTDDYMTKPFEPEELLVRVNALLKRYHIETSKSVKIGTLLINKNNYQVFTEKESFTLPLKEFELLFKLASYAGKTFTRDRLIEDIWGYGFEGNERTLDVHINRLRDKFPEAVYGFKIVTIRGLGYKLDVLAHD